MIECVFVGYIIVKHVFIFHKLKNALYFCLYYLNYIVEQDNINDVTFKKDKK